MREYFLFIIAGTETVIFVLGAVGALFVDDHMYDDTTKLLTSGVLASVALGWMAVVLLWSNAKLLQEIKDKTKKEEEIRTPREDEQESSSEASTATSKDGS